MDVVVRSLNGLLMIALPLCLGVVLIRRFRLGWGLFGVGVATFLGSQLLHLPFNQWVLNPMLDRLGLATAGPGLPLIWLGVSLGLSAGVFEEGARALVYRLWLRQARSWREALVFGTGHGGIEAIVLGVLVLYGLLQALALRGVDLATVVPAEQIEATRAGLDAYWAAPWHLAILGALERAFALCMHLAATVLVLQTFRRHNGLWLLAAVAWHALVDAAAVVTAASWGPYWAEAVIGLLAAASLGIVVLLRDKPAAEADGWIGSFAAGAAPAPGLELRKDRLDGTRFSG